jgi:hypothetical protein
MPTYKFTYNVGKEEKSINKKFEKLWFAIEGFWDLPEIITLKLADDHVSLKSIKEVKEEV